MAGWSRFFYCLPIGPMASSVWVSHRSERTKENDGRQGERQEGCVARDAGADGAEDAAGDGSIAWIWHSAAHRADERRSSGCELWNPVSGVAQARAGGLHPLRMGFLGQQSQSKVLQAHARGPETIE